MTIQTVTLGSFKHSTRFSRETLAFTATLLINGKKAGTVENDGHGGSCEIHLTDRSLMPALVEYAKALPPVTTEYGTLEMNLDFLLSRLASDAADAAETAKVERKHAKKAAEVRAHGLTYWTLTYPGSYVAGWNKPENLDGAIANARAKYGEAGVLKVY